MSATEFEPSELRKQIAKAFPAEPFLGDITPDDGHKWCEELDDALDLAVNLKGKTWSAVPQDFVDRHAGDLPLLSPRAFAAFLPAWLDGALVDTHNESDVRDHVVFVFAPFQNDQPWSKAFRRSRLLCLDADQIRVIRGFLTFISNTDPSSFLRACALDALTELTELFDRSP
ncbi:MAG TPA: DUF6714 family protein [Bryobacteraceae bacterium]|nr:DUF6714 family protein [Bryobacteraceae bacterium]